MGPPVCATSTAFHVPIGSSTENPRGTARMRHAPQWDRPHASRSTQYSVPWPHKELHRRPR
eukprot:612969-Pyramimonas_sp.AAC.1